MYQFLRLTDWAEITGSAAKMVFDLGQGGEAKAGVETGHLADLDFIHVMVAAQQQQPDLGLDDLACSVRLVGGQYQ